MEAPDDYQATILSTLFGRPLAPQSIPPNAGERLAAFIILSPGALGSSRVAIGATGCHRTMGMSGHARVFPGNWDTCPVFLALHECARQQCRSKNEQRRLFSHCDIPGDLGEGGFLTRRAGLGFGQRTKPQGVAESLLKIRAPSWAVNGVSGIGT
ncbi:unnamed protein product [Gadus morhua 'NCC']